VHNSWLGCWANVLPIIGVVILVLCLFGWRFAVGSTPEGPGMTCFSLGSRGWAFFTVTGLLLSNEKGTIEG